jgi:hypothetical protein
MKSPVDKLLKKHKELVHSDEMEVISHVQRNKDDWIINTLMIQDCEVPFRFTRRRKYKDLKGARVNLTYYPTTELVAGFEMQMMKVVRVKIA